MDDDNEELLAIEGLDAAAVGSALVDDRLALVYDYDKCVEIVIGAGNSIDYAEEYIWELSSSSIKGLPIFVHFDNDLEYYGETPSVGATTVH